MAHYEDIVQDAPVRHHDITAPTADNDAEEETYAAAAAAHDETQDVSSPTENELSYVDGPTFDAEDSMVAAARVDGALEMQFADNAAREASVDEPLANECAVEPPSKRVKLDSDNVHDNAANDVELIHDTATAPLLSPILNSAHHASSSNATKPERKQRKEFTASEKLAILSELDTINPPSIKELLSKYNLSKSSFHRWRNPEYKRRLIEMVASGEEKDTTAPSTLANNENTADPPSLLYKGHKKRDMLDGLYPLKRALQRFLSYNASLPEEKQYAIRSGFLQAKARELRNTLITEARIRQEEIDEWNTKKKQPTDNAEYNDGYSEYNATEPPPQPILSPLELKTLQNFKGSKSWACHITSQLGLHQTQWSEISELNTTRYLEEAALATSGPLSGVLESKRPKKLRTEFLAVDKIRILREIEESNAERKKMRLPIWTVDEICERYGTSKSSLHRWRQQQRSGQLESVVEEGGGGTVKRVSKDRLTIVKKALVEYVEERGDGRVSFGMLQMEALRIRDELVGRYERVYGVPAVVAQGEEKGVVEGGGGEESGDGVTVDAGAIAEENTVTEGEVVDAVGGAVVETTNANVVENKIVTEAEGNGMAVVDGTNNFAEENATKESAGETFTSNEASAVPNDESTSVPADQVVMATQHHDGNPEPDNDPPVAEAITESSATSQISKDEYQALRIFKASLSWLRDLAKKHNFNMDTADDAKLDWGMDESRRVLYETYYHHSEMLQAQEEHATEDEQVINQDVSAEESQNRIIVVDQQQAHHDAAMARRQRMIKRSLKEDPSIHPNVSVHEPHEHYDQEHQQQYQDMHHGAVLAEEHVEQILAGNEGPVQADNGDDTYQIV
jgi:transposase-like protein